MERKSVHPVSPRFRNPSVIALTGLGLVSLLGLRRLKNRQA